MSSLRSLLTAALLCLATLVAVPAPAHAAQPVTYDFESGTQGWGPRGDGVSVTASSELARSGTASLLVTGRSENWHGAVVAPHFAEGRTYTVTAFARAVAGESTVALTVQRTPDGGDTVYERVAAATVGDAGWVELSGRYTFTGASTDLQLYAESSDPAAAYRLDDVTITEESGSGGEDGTSTDFETGTAQGWRARASATLAATASAARRGGYGLAVSDRSASWDGPALDVLPVMAKGAKYTASIWVRPEAATSLGLSIERRSGDTPSYDRIAAPREVAAGQWTELKGTYTLGHDVDFLSVYVESASDTTPFAVDDFTLVHVPAVPIQRDIPALKDVLGFTIGTAVQRPQTLGEHGELLRRHFESVTPGNQLKWDATEPREGEFTFAEGDHLVDHAHANGLKVRGHTLAWHSQTPDWVFEGTKADVLRRLENHIRAVAGRYKGRLYAWDVVNEVVDENQPDGLRRSKWFQTTGLDYIRTAFRVAREVDPDAKLYINDYNTEFPRKRRALYELVKKLRAEGVPIDGVGHQLHVNIEQPHASEIEETIELIAGLGVDQQVTELDVSVYTDFVQSYPEIPAALLLQQGHRYKEIFDVFRRQSGHLSSVTLWGLADDDTWLSTFPITRLNAPLLFDDRLQAKPAYWGVVDPSRLEPLVHDVEVPEGTPRIDGRRDREWDLLPDVRPARNGGLSAGVQFRRSAKGLSVLAEVTDPSRDGQDTVTVTVGGADHVIRRTGPHAKGPHAKGLRAHVGKTPGGYRVEALLPAGASGAGGVRLTVRDASSQDTLVWAGEMTPVPAVRTTAAVRGTPKVDGTVDAVWARAPEIRTATWVQGTAGATARVRALWDAGRLHVLARVSDPRLSEESPDAWQQDSVEIFVDADNGKTKGYGDDDGQYRISFTGRRTVGGPLDPAAIEGNLTSAVRQVPGGYVVEATIELPTAALGGDALLGFDVQVNDATGASRTAAATWSDPTGLAHLSTARWGVLGFAR
ncbi:endo-1,4-beta-xylanase [Planomonospora parontospora]|uniref:endo-1,4-beta-xylanase n=1 Tax=Planomonospora parontospora TaxID=58119 RepID=UPI00166FE576|nr:endo-1,4-beta-xylanase [Planomonospora parontospora]GGL27298.1 beta-xylanase [Planomonospora parontospora subsp. antibiotica]GII16541.1 beta-xylanase [Planomonospora parontospora subsp. antibiotica]